MLFGHDHIDPDNVHAKPRKLPRWAHWAVAAAMLFIVIVMWRM